MRITNDVPFSGLWFRVHWTAWPIDGYDSHRNHNKPTMDVETPDVNMLTLYTLHESLGFNGSACSDGNQHKHESLKDSVYDSMFRLFA